MADYLLDRRFGEGVQRRPKGQLECARLGLASML
jgi:hypothetical protein